MPHRFADIFEQLPSETQELLNSRYGRPARRIWKLVAFILLAIGLPWLMWSGWYHSNPATRVTLVSFNPINEKSISIEFQLDRAEPEVENECTLIARDYDRNIVGEIDIRVPPGKKSNARITAEIPTRLRAVNAAVLECRAVTAP